MPDQGGHEAGERVGAKTLVAYDEDPPGIATKVEIPQVIYDQDAGGNTLFDTARENPKALGYSGFLSIAYFDKDENVLAWGAWE